MNQLSDIRFHAGKYRGIYKLLFLLSLLFSISFGDLHAQSFDRQLEKIEAMQNRAVYDSALILANTMLANDGLKSEEVLALLLSKQASFYFLGKFDSMRNGNKMLAGKIASSSKLYPNWLLVKGVLSGEEGGYVESIRLLKEAEVIFEERKDAASLGKLYNFLGANFSKLEEPNQAKAYFKKARTTYGLLGDSVRVVLANNNLGSVYRGESKLDSALYYYQEAARMLTGLSNTFLLAQNQLNIGGIYEEQGDLDDAEAYFMRCFTLSEGAGINYGMLLSRLNLGNVYRLKKDYTKSKRWLDLALDQAKTMKVPREEAYALERLSWLARDTEDYEGAYLLGLEAVSIKDSLLSESVKKESLALQERYESEKKTNEILLLESDNQRNVLILFLCGIGILMLVILLLYVGYRQNKLLNQKLLSEVQQKKLSNEIQVKDMELTAQVLEILRIKNLLEEQRSNASEGNEGQGAVQTEMADYKQETFELLKHDLENRITNSNEDFYQKLLEAYPDLKPSELKLCSYLRLNLSTKALAEILNKSVRTIENTRFSIRKKMNLDPDDNLVAHLIVVLKK